MEMIKNLTCLSKWTAVLGLLIAPLAAPVMAQETGTVKISGRFSMDYLSGELDLSIFDPDLLGVYYNGHEHTWTLTLHGTSQSHISNGSYYGTEIHSTSFDLEFFGPDAATLNGIVSEHIAGGDVSVYLENAYSAGFGGDFSGIRRFAQRDHKNIVHWSTFDHGGHFAAHKVPDLLTGDVRTFFHQLQ